MVEGPIKHVARANPSTQQTNTELVPARPGYRVKALYTYMSSDTEMTVTLVNGSSHTIVWRQYVGERGGSAPPVRFWSEKGEGLDYTTSTNGNIFIMVEYEYVT